MTDISFELTSYDNAIMQLIRNIQEGLSAEDAILGKIPTHTVSHGGPVRQVSEPQIVDTQTEVTKAMFEMSSDALLETDTAQFAESVYNMIESFHSQQKKRLFDVVSLTTEAVGNSIDAHGKNFWDAYIEMIQRTEMTFDEQGNHDCEIYLHPDTAKKLVATPPTPEQSQRIKQLIETKRREYYARKPSRKLS